MNRQKFEKGKVLRFFPRASIGLANPFHPGPGFSSEARVCSETISPGNHYQIKSQFIRSQVTCIGSTLQPETCQGARIEHVRQG